MDMYFNKLIRLLNEKKYKDACELVDILKKMHKNNCKEHRYTNLEIAMMDYSRIWRYHEFANDRHLRQIRKETEMFKQFCEDFVKIVKEGLTEES